jgi:enamine deaminase RidA (YjgF/YER057c/UK114 family)
VKLSGELTKPLAKYPHSKTVGNLVFLAGQGCRDPKTDICAGLKKDSSGDVVEYDILSQTQGVLKNIERALTPHGLDRTDLLDVTVFLVSMNDFDKMNTVWNAFFEDCESPVRTTVAVRELPGENYIEMKAVAKLKSE